MSLFFLVSGTSAQSLPSSETADTKQEWRLTADKVTYNRELDEYTGEGNVIIRKPGVTLTADRITFNNTTMTAVAQGNVRMTSGQDELTGNRLEMALDSEIGTIYDGTLFLTANHFYITGDKIEKTGPQNYTADRVSMTTCGQDVPDWKITGRDLEITVEGYGTLKHAALWAKKLPVGYTPFFFFPAKRNRQSGFLSPEFSSSERKGMEYVQPYYWAIDDSSDATFYGHFMGTRGFKYGAEYRYKLDAPSQGSIMFDFLDDRKIDDGQNNSSSDYGYEDDRFTRPNSDRYWLRMKADQTFGPNLTGKLDLDIVSDQDYLHDFKRGYTGYNITNRYFEEEFGRSLDDYDDSTRLNRFNISRSWSQFTLHSELRWYDNVIKRRWWDYDTTLQQLPLIEFDAARQQIPGSPFYYNLESTYKYYYRSATDSLFMRGHILDAYPRIYLPLRYQRFFSFEPSLGFRQTLWYANNSGQDIHNAGFDWEDEHSFQHREIYDLSLDLSTDLERIYHPMHTSGIEKIKHRIKPQIIYSYTPRIDQDQYPRFESIEEEDNGDITIDDSLSWVDRIKDRNRITYSITNTFTAKTLAQIQSGPSDTPDASPAESSPAYRYRQFARFKLQQSYIFDESDVDDDEPFSDILAELDIYPSPYISLETDARWNPYENGFATHSIALDLTDTTNHLYIEHRYSRNYDESRTETVKTPSGTRITIYDSDTDSFENAESIYANLRYEFSSQLHGYGEYEHNIETHETILSRIGLQYQSQCWSLDVNYTEEENDAALAFMIHLHGLGEIGTQVSKPE